MPEHFSQDVADRPVTRRRQPPDRPLEPFERIDRLAVRWRTNVTGNFLNNGVCTSVPPAALMHTEGS